ncbi:MAG: class I SAM-dependent methyltransferase [Asgard group archaeon]|nr:class I SAM-dependent methyltransferase [Asgard group archaeon]
MSTKIKDESKAYRFDFAAHFYSLFTGFILLLIGIFENNFRQRILQESLPIKGKERVLDICCANGKGTKILTTLIPNGTIHAIDLNPHMIMVAKKRTKNTPNLFFKVGNCAAIPYSDNNFDIVNSFLALHEIPTNLVRNVILEVKRVMKPEGFLVVFDFTIPYRLTPFQKMIYYVLRLIEDESAARFMMVDQKQLLERDNFILLKRKEYLYGLAEACIYKLS